MSVVVNRTTKFICAIEAEDEVPPAGANPTAVTHAERVHWLVAPATSHIAHRFAWHRVCVPLLLAAFAASWCLASLNRFAAFRAPFVASPVWEDTWTLHDGLSQNSLRDTYSTRRDKYE